MGVARNVLNWYAKLSPRRGRALPPYDHVIQIGDPTLRKVCDPVPLDKIKTTEVQAVIHKLKHVLNKYESVGMAAPQIGVNLRIFALQHTANQIAVVPIETVATRGITVVPLTVFINPKLKVMDYQKVFYPEGCESIRGFSADVPRYREVEISGYDAQGQAITRQFKHWTARIAQHELDHLDGKLYTDIMDRKTLFCTCWEEVNLSRGKVALPFNPE